MISIKMYTNTYKLSPNIYQLIFYKIRQKIIDSLVRQKEVHTPLEEHLEMLINPGTFETGS